LALPLKWMPAAAHGGAFTGGAPVGLAVHSTESENTPAMAEALAGPNWFGGSKAGTSAHKVVDVDSICEGVKRTIIAYHAGPGGNVIAIAYEFCGRAGWSAAKWREPAQLQMLRNAAPHMADDLRAIGSPARWLSLAQLAAVARSKRPADGGLFTHNDIRLALGGTTHSDPGQNFPYAELLAYVQAELAGTSTAAASDLEEQELMAAKDEIIAAIISHLEAGTNTRLVQLLDRSDGRPLLGYRSDPQQSDEQGIPGDGAMYVGGNGVWTHLEPGYPALHQARGTVGEFKNMPPNEIRYWQAFWNATKPETDTAELVAVMKDALSAATAEQIAKAVNDDAARRLAA
jgi:hypothetical protein